MSDYTLHTIDLNFLGFTHVIAAYALVGRTSVALVETGPGSTLPVLLESLRELGVQPEDVREVLVTHIHLDHAGAAGWWARQGATIYVHPLGAPHLIDPSKLLASAQRIYGDKMDFLWGEFLPSAPERVRVVNDGEAVTAAGAELTAINSPGHARHHHCWRLGDIAFTGDATSVRLPDAQWIAIPAPPPEFDLEAWQDTLRRLSGLNLQTVYPTHFGAIADPGEHIERLGVQLVESAEFVRARMAEGLDRDQIVAQYSTWQAEQAAAANVGVATLERYGKANSSSMSVDGIMRYWTKRLQA